MPDGNEKNQNRSVRRMLVASAIPGPAIDQLFDTARTHNEWSEKPVDESTIRKLYEHVKWGPTSANSSPARFVWVRSA